MTSHNCIKNNNDDSVKRKVISVGRYFSENGIHLKFVSYGNKISDEWKIENAFGVVSMCVTGTRLLMLKLLEVLV